MPSWFKLGDFICFTSSISGQSGIVFLLPPVFGPRHEKTCLQGFRQVRFKPASSATETSQKIEIALEASLGMIVLNTWITKALIRLGRCTGWSAPLLFANHKDRFSQVVAHFINRTLVLLRKTLHSEWCISDVIVNFSDVRFFNKSFKQNASYKS